MKNIFLNSLILSALLFVGCSDDSNDSIPDRNESEVVENPEVNETDNEIVENPEVNETDNEIVVNPEINETVETKTISIPLCDEVIILESGDKIQKVSENPQVEIQHLASGSKSICVKSGEAIIKR